MKIYIAICLIGVCTATNEEFKCPANEVFKTCGTACEPTCENPDSSQPCIEICLINVCQCAEGFVRNSLGACVQLNQCDEQIPKCPVNEEFKTCGTYCEPTCENLNPICIQMCKENVCQCVKDYVRQGSVCIPENECPKKTF